MSKADHKKRDALLAAKQAEDEYEEDEQEQAERTMAEQRDQTDQIVRTGAITATKGKHVIHCLTIVGQVAMVDNATI